MLYLIWDVVLYVALVEVTKLFIDCYFEEFVSLGQILYHEDVVQDVVSYIISGFSTFFKTFDVFDIFKRVFIYPKIPFLCQY